MNVLPNRDKHNLPRNVAVVVFVNFINTCNWDSGYFFMPFLCLSRAATGTIRLSFGELFDLQGRVGGGSHIS
jgi:hypothetical protein